MAEPLLDSMEMLKGREKTWGGVQWRSSSVWGLGGILVGHVNHHLTWVSLMCDCPTPKLRYLTFRWKIYTRQVPCCMCVHAPVYGYGKVWLSVASCSQIWNYWHFCAGHKATNCFYTQNALEITWAVTDRSACCFANTSLLSFKSGEI